MEWAQGHPHPSSKVPTRYLHQLPPSRAEQEAKAGTPGPVALQRGLWHLGGCPIPAPTGKWGQAGCHHIWASMSPKENSSFGKSLKAHIPQRASSPSAVTRWIWYSEFWSIWRRTWYDLQRGNRERLPSRETKFCQHLCHQPHRRYYSLNQHFGSTPRGDNTLRWRYFYAHLRVLHQTRLRSLSC